MLCTCGGESGYCPHSRALSSVVVVQPVLHVLHDVGLQLLAL